MEKVGTKVYHTWNSRTTTVIKLVSKWHHLRNCMNDSVERHCSRVRLEKVIYLVQKYWKMPRSRFKWLEKIRLLSPDRWALRIKGEEIYHSKLVILYTLRFPLWEHSKIQSHGKVSYKICQSIQDHWLQGRSGLSTRVAATAVRHTWRISCVAAQEVLASSIGTTANGETWPRGDLTYNERLIKILYTVERVTHNKVIKMCKVQWSHHTEDEATWEHK
jgi:hypothetical protein